MTRVCRLCGERGECVTAPADKEQVVAEPPGWAVVTIHAPGLSPATLSSTICRSCLYDLPTLLHGH